jgi:hypothetical protein
MHRQEAASERGAADRSGAHAASEELSPRDDARLAAPENVEDLKTAHESRNTQPAGRAKWAEAGALTV